MMVMCIRKHCYCSKFSTLQGASERCCINETLHPEIDMTRKPARLQAFSDDHFGADPERLNWSDLGSLKYQAHLLKQISDFAFGEGEYAA